MKKMILTLILINTMLVAESFALDIVDGLERVQEDKVGEVAQVVGDVRVHCAKSSSQGLIAGDEFKNHCFLVSKNKAYVKGILWDYSIFHLGANSAVEVRRVKGEVPEIRVHQGQFRILNFKEPKIIHYSGKVATIDKGEFLWSLENPIVDKGNFIVISGEASVDSKKVIPIEEINIKEEELAKNKNVERPWRRLFLNLPTSSKSTYQPKFSSRSIASMEGNEAEVAEFEDFLDEEDSFSPPSVKKEIWVHDIIYDSVVKAVEKAVFAKADKLIPTAIEAACDDLVWEVANRSVIKWGAKYAYVAGAKEIAPSVASSLNEASVEDTNLYDRELFQKSAEEIATIRSYRRAKNAAEIGGYDKGWREAQEYAMALIPEVVLPVVRELLYKEAKVAGMLAAEGVLETTKLLRTDDVDQLIEHLSQVASEKIAMERINKYSAYFTEKAAKRAALEVAKGASEEIAQYVASKASNAAGEIMQRKIAQKRAKSVARSIASRNKKNEALKAQSHGPQTLRETSR